MFFKIKKALVILLLYIIPLNAFAYSKYLIAGGNTVGIRLNTDGVMIVGSYEIDGHNNLIESGLQNGDIITSINNNKIDNIDKMATTINNCNCSSIDLKYERNSKTYNTTLTLYYDNNVALTGLYVKDSISGIGTLTYIDPNTKIFGVLGHEITDNNGNIFNSSKGSIFDSKVTGITKSNIGNPGEKNAIIFNESVNGNIYENTNKGVFGIYTSDINNNTLYEVALLDNIKLGSAKILTVISDNSIEEFNINILSVKNTKSNLKNIEFEINDERLINETNGIIQGMSGSPIIQGNYIIGAVTHVVVEDPHKGYGILITNMLEESEN